MLCMTVVEVRRSQLLRGVLDVCLLALISEQPLYGYEMTRRLGERGLASVGEGSIYPVLGRLQEGGLVETFLEPSSEGPARRYYRPTTAGRAALQRWTSEWRELETAVDAVLARVETEVEA